MSKFNFDNVQQFVNKDLVLAKLSEEQIYSRYCSEFPSALMCSPLRPDKSPSFGFYQSETGKWMWKDFNPSYGSGDVFEFVMRKFNCDFMTALRQVINDFDLEHKIVYQDTIESPRNNKQVDPSRRSFIQAVYTKLTERDYDLWSLWNIGPGILREYDVKAALEIWKKKPRVDKEKVLWGKYKIPDPMYYWKSPYSNHIKAYRPLHDNKKGKWLSNCDNITDVQGYKQCNIKMHKRPLILTKSMKEVMFFRGWGFNAMAGHTEGSTFNKDFIRHLYKYCHPIISVYDNDPAGVLGAMKMNKLYGIPGVFICNAHDSRFKDPTDVWRYEYRKWYDTLNLISNQIDYYARTQQQPVFDQTTEFYHS